MAYLFFLLIITSCNIFAMEKQKTVQKVSCESHKKNCTSFKTGKRLTALSVAPEDDLIFTANVGEGIKIWEIESLGKQKQKQEQEQPILQLQPSLPGNIQQIILNFSYKRTKTKTKKINGDLLAGATNLSCHQAAKLGSVTFWNLNRKNNGYKPLSGTLPLLFYGVALICPTISKRGINIYGNEHRTFQIGEEISQLKLGEDNKLLVLTIDGQLKKYNLNSLAQEAHSDPNIGPRSRGYTHLVESKKYYITASQSLPYILIYDSKSLEMKIALKAPSFVSAMKRCGNYLVIASEGEPKSLSIWDLRNLKQFSCIKTDHTRKITHLETFGMNHIITGSLDGKVNIYNLKKGELINTTDRHSWPVFGLKHLKIKNETGKIQHKLLIAYENGLVEIWDRLDK